MINVADLITAVRATLLTVPDFIAFLDGQSSRLQDFQDLMTGSPEFDYPSAVNVDAAIQEMKSPGAIIYSGGTSIEAGAQSRVVHTVFIAMKARFTSDTKLSFTAMAASLVNGRVNSTNLPFSSAQPLDTVLPPSFSINRQRDSNDMPYYEAVLSYEEAGDTTFSGGI